MRIKKISISRYGPLSNLELDPGDGIQIICGRNEAGKTLTIDAVIKMMLKGRVKDFEYIDRVDEDPEGYIILEDDKKNEIKLSIKKGLGEYLNLGSIDLRNIFIIRNSDLTIKEKGDYFKNITDKLTGLQSERLDKILVLLKEYGKLTAARSDASLSNSKEHKKITSIKNAALSFKNDAASYIEEARSKKSDFLELDLLKLKQNISDTKKEIELQERAYSKERYNKLSGAIENLKDSYRDYKEVRKYTRKQYNDIHSTILEIDSLKKETSSLGGKLEKISEKKDSLNEEARKVKSEIAPLKEKQGEIKKIRMDLDIYNSRKGEELKSSNKRIYYILMFTTLGFIPVSFVIVYPIIKSIYPSFIIPGIFLAFFIFFVSKILDINRREKKFGKGWGNIIGDFRSLGFSVNDLDEVAVKIGKFNDNYSVICMQKDSLDNDLKVLEMSEKETKEMLDKLDNRKAEVEGEIDDIFNDFNVNSVGEFSEKLELKNKLESEIIVDARSIVSDLGLEASLEAGSDFEKVAEGLDDCISKWVGNIKDLEPENIDEPDKGLIFDSNRLDELKEKLKDYEEKKENLNFELEGHKSSLNNFERRFSDLELNNFIDDYSSIKIGSLDKLSEAMDAVDYFLEKVSQEYSIAIESIKIFEEVRKEEAAKISDLFNRLNASDYFNDITNGRYSKVEFDSTSQTVKVVDKSGKVLDASKLSKGAYDQLFLAIRIALSEKILGSEKGFFIMDDAFLTSDKNRLENQFKILKSLCSGGWSILYFTVKEEVRKLASKYSKNKVIVMEEM
jgi:uncharacterized protein YhaN